VRTHNLDIHPTEDTVAHYPALAPLVNNKSIQDDFDGYEDEAVRKKRAYQTCGKWSVWLIAASALYSVAYSTFGLDFPRQVWISFVFALCGAAGIILQIHIWHRDLKNAWLVARYAAERVRSIKFQAFFLAGLARNDADLALKADEYYRSGLVALRNEINGDIAVLRSFRPHDAINVEEESLEPNSRPLYDSARKAYRVLRLDYQRNFAAAEVEKLKSQGRPKRSLSDNLFVTGAVLVLATIVFKIAGQMGWIGEGDIVHSAERWLEFLSVSVFILSVTLSILDNASTADVSEQRYDDYRRGLDTVRTEVELAKAPFNDEIRRTEKLALRELQDFCASASLINYRI
jgi:hypothetical protein